MISGNSAINGCRRTENPGTVATGGPIGVFRDSVTPSSVLLGIKKAGDDFYSFAAEISAFFVETILSLNKY